MNLFIIFLRTDMGMKLLGFLQIGFTSLEMKRKIRFNKTRKTKTEKNVVK